MSVKIKRIKSKDPKRVEINISFAFDADDPQAASIYKGIALLMLEALTPDERLESMVQLEIESLKIADEIAVARKQGRKK